MRFLIIVIIRARSWMHMASGFWKILASMHCIVILQVNFV